jgi:uncharacterized protein (TIGR02186 family)
MRWSRRSLLLGLTLLLPLAVPVRPAVADLVAALSNHLVAITTGFSGTDVLLFGTTIGGSGDVVVVIRGPENAEIVRRRGRHAGIWVNDAEMVFEQVPGFYAVAASRPPGEFLPERTANRHQIGTEYLRLVPRRVAPGENVATFREALIRNKQKLNLYSREPEKITFVGGTLFRADMHIPANAPVGSYAVGVYLVRDGDVVAAEITPLLVSKVGFEARVYDFAYRYSLAYGVLAILIAAVAGWLASLVFRKG